jgi:ABC-type transport system substrate-binding protein
MHEIMVHDLAQIGVEVELESRDPAGFFAYMNDVNQQVEGEPAVWTTGMDGVDPDYLYFLWRRPGFVNMGLNPQLDELLDEQRHLTGDARVAKLREIQRYLLEQVYMVPILSPGWGWLMASSKRVQGFKTGFMVGLIFNDVKMAE